MTNIFKAFNINDNTSEKVLIICADLETTGLDLKTADVIEIGACAHCDEVKSFSGLIRPESGLVPIEASAINGISETELTFMPCFAVRIGQFMQFVKDLKVAANADKVLLLFHNGFRFDISIFRRQCKEQKVDIPAWLFGSDTLPMLDAVFPGKFGKSKGNKTLLCLSKLYDVKLPTHRALQDATALSAILAKLEKNEQVMQWLYSNRISMHY